MNTIPRGYFPQQLQEITGYEAALCVWRYMRYIKPIIIEELKEKKCVHIRFK
jgi:phosphatidylglycerophosphatase A